MYFNLYYKSYTFSLEPYIIFTLYHIMMAEEVHYTLLHICCI